MSAEAHASVRAAMAAVDQAVEPSAGGARTAMEMPTLRMPRAQERRQGLCRAICQDDFLQSGGRGGKNAHEDEVELEQPAAAVEPQADGQRVAEREQHDGDDAEDGGIRGRIRVGEGRGEDEESASGTGASVMSVHCVIEVVARG